MHIIWDGIKDAFDLIVHGDADTFGIVGFTLKVAVLSTLFALALGLPAGLALGLARFRGRGTLMAFANAGMGLPPVVVGVWMFLLLLREGPLGGLGLLYTPGGVILAQTVLAFPLVAALTGAAVQGVGRPLLDQARALGASRAQVWTLALREARVGVLAATIAALGSALSEVGAVVIVGGNIHGQTQTLASAMLVKISGGFYGEAIALSLILLVLIVALVATLTVLQQRAART